MQTQSETQSVHPGAAGPLGAASRRHPTPELREVLRAEIRSVGIATRRQLLLIATGLLVLVALAVDAVARQRIEWQSTTNVQAAVMLLAALCFPAAIFGLVWPSSVWREEGPGRRAYHWALPVGRRTHALLKASAGWLWLMVVGAAAVFTLAVVLPAIAGQALFAGMPAWIWVAPFAAATVTYLLGTVAALRSDHPVRLLLAIYLGTAIVIGVIRVTVSESLGRGIRSLWSGRFGLRVALFPLQSGRPPITFDADWPLAVGFWTAIGLAAAYLAADRHQEY